MQQLTAPAAPLYWTNGRFQVEIQTPRPGEHNVVTSHARPGGTRIDTLSAPIPSPALARTIARVITLSLRNAPATANAVKAIDNARRAVLANIDGQLAMVLASPAAIDTVRGQILQTVRALYTSTEDQDAADQTAADLNATLDERAAAQQPVADAAADYLATLAAQRQERIEQAVAAADAKPTTLDPYVLDPKRANAPRLRNNTPSARKLSKPMTDMLADLHRAAKDDRGLTLTTARQQTTAYALRRRGLADTRRVTTGILHVRLATAGTQGVAA